MMGGTHIGNREKSNGGRLDGLSSAEESDIG